MFPYFKRINRHHSGFVYTYIYIYVAYGNTRVTAAEPRDAAAEGQARDSEPACRP